VRQFPWARKSGANTAADPREHLSNSHPSLRIASCLTTLNSQKPYQHCHSSHWHDRSESPLQKSRHLSLQATKPPRPLAWFFCELAGSENAATQDAIRAECRSLPLPASTTGSVPLDTAAITLPCRLNLVVCGPGRCHPARPACVLRDSVNISRLAEANRYMCLLRSSTARWSCGNQMRASGIPSGE
jgi:hypothetical protein